MIPETPVIEVKNVVKSFKTVQAVRGVSLRIFQGQFVALLGPNGAGKTTLVEMIEGIQKPDEGEICILERSGKGMRANCGSSSGCLFRKPGSSINLPCVKL